MNDKRGRIKPEKLLNFFDEMKKVFPERRVVDMNEYSDAEKAFIRMLQRKELPND